MCRLFFFLTSISRGQRGPGTFTHFPISDCFLSQHGLCWKMNYFYYYYFFRDYIFKISEIRGENSVLARKRFFFFCLNSTKATSDTFPHTCLTNKGIFCLYSVVQGHCSRSSVSLPESLLFVSTLDGNLHAVSKRSGSIKWTLKEGKHTLTNKNECFYAFPALCINKLHQFALP